MEALTEGKRILSGVILLPLRIDRNCAGLFASSSEARGIM
jgi:hypothetical protein